MSRSQLTRRRIVALAVVAVGVAVGVAQSAGSSGSPGQDRTRVKHGRAAATVAPAPTAAPPAAPWIATSALPAAGPPRSGVAQPVPVTPGVALAPVALPPRLQPIEPCASDRRSSADAPPSRALLDAFAILRRDRTSEDELPAAALRALRVRGLASATPDAARLLRSAGDARAWVVPVPDVHRVDPFVCRQPGRSPREGIAVVAIGDVPAGGGGALRDLVRGLAPVALDPCAGKRRDMLGVSGIVPDGVPAVFLTAPDGSAVRADVRDNGFSFVVPRGRTPEPRYVVWTGSDGTPHVQPLLVFAGVGRVACGRPSPRPAVTPTGLHDCGPLPLIVPRARGRGPKRLVVPPALPRPPAVFVPRGRGRPLAVFVPHGRPRSPRAVAPRASRGRGRPELALLPRAPVFMPPPCEIGIPPGVLPAPMVPPRVIAPAPARRLPLPAKPPRKRGP